MIPFLSTLERAERVLIAGCGGGFDVFAGVPIAQQAMRAGKQVIFANFSFTNLSLCGGEQITPTTWRVDEQSDDIPYFPERWLAEWLAAHGRVPPIYAFAKSGVRPLRAAYSLIMERHDIDLCVLVDGGTDSVLFGDEPSLGTVVEDAVSTVGACAATEKQVVLAAIGFGVDHHHGVSHHAFLENAARLTHQVNPLMSQYWTFDARRVVGNMSYAAELAETEGIEAARLAIERRREGLELRSRR